MEHYFSKEQNSIFRPEKIKARAAGLELDFYTSKGVFSPSRLDRGSALLISKGSEFLKAMKHGKVLDLGCGWGAVGIFTALCNPALKVTMTDVNERALKLSRMNIKMNNAKNAEVISSDSFKGIRSGNFEMVLFNPPQKAGKNLCFRLVSEAWGCLCAGGRLLLVARHNKGGKPLKEHMESVFGNSQTAARSGGFHVYSSEKRHSAP